MEKGFNPKVSIVIPVYNGSNYMREAIDSALMQSYKNIEVIVVNDGSNDDGKTEAIAKSYGDKIHYIKKENGGVASALNIGINKMIGDYFSWLSHDDVYYPNKIERQIEYLSRQPNKNIILYSDFDLIGSDSKILQGVVIPHYEPKQFLYELIERSFLHGCTLLIPKVCFDKTNGFNESLATIQDYELWVRMAKEYNFIHLPEKLIQGRSHPGQGSLKSAHFKELDDFYVWCLDELPTEAITDIYNIPISRFFLNLADGYSKRNLSNAYHAAMHKAVTYSRQEGIVSYIMLLLSSGKAITCFKKTISHVRFAVNSFCRIVTNKILTIFLPGILAKNKFTEVYENNLFGGDVSKSGRGSDLVQTSVIRAVLPELIKELDIKSLLDAPCGDFFWMKGIELDSVQYIGIDIVQNVVDTNNSQYGNAKRAFQCKDLIRDTLPKADLIFCRDCLVHLAFNDCKKILNNFKKSGSIYLLTTTFTNRKENEDLNGGFWRALNLELPPFNFPKPIKIINENCTEGNGKYTDKCLGLWTLDVISCS